MADSFERKVSDQKAAIALENDIRLEGRSETFGLPRPSIIWAIPLIALVFLYLFSSLAPAEILAGRVVGVADGDTVTILEVTAISNPEDLFRGALVVHSGPNNDKKTTVENTAGIVS
jgi:hypothetical protein